MFIAADSIISRAVLGTVGTALCAGLCLFAATAPATADTVRTVTVGYSDLNVHSASGRATLDRRVQNAARSVCTSADTGPAARIEEGRCVRNALAHATPVAG